MAARKRVGLSENTRERIKTSMLVNRLEDHILGKVELSQSQVRGIEILLKKTLPDLQSTTLATDPDNPLDLKSKIVVEIVKPGNETNNT